MATWVAHPVLRDHRVRTNRQEQPCSECGVMLKPGTGTRGLWHNVIDNRWRHVDLVLCWDNRKRWQERLLMWWVDCGRPGGVYVALNHDKMMLHLQAEGHWPIPDDYAPIQEVRRPVKIKRYVPKK